MPYPEAVVQTIKISDVKSNLSGIVNTVASREARVLIEKGGVPVAAIISADDLRRLSQFEQRREERFKVIDELREAFKDVPPEEIERETDRIIARIRAEERERAAEEERKRVAQTATIR